MWAFPRRRPFFWFESFIFIQDYRQLGYAGFVYYSRSRGIFLGDRRVFFLERMRKGNRYKQNNFGYWRLKCNLSSEAVKMGAFRKAVFLCLLGGGRSILEDSMAFSSIRVKDLYI